MQSSYIGHANNLSLKDVGLLKINDRSMTYIANSRSLLKSSYRKMQIFLNDVTGLGSEVVERLPRVTKLK